MTTAVVGLCLLSWARGSERSVSSCSIVADGGCDAGSREMQVAIKWSHGKLVVVGCGCMRACEPAIGCKSNRVWPSKTSPDEQKSMHNLPR
jgi:hypothetical protein